MDSAPRDSQISTPSFCVVEVLDVSVTLPATYAEVQLNETDAPYRMLSFPIALPEAAAIVQAQSKTAGARPMTHEIYSETLRRFSIDIVALRITARVDGVLYAELDLMGSRGREVLACRPSDGIAMCLRQIVPAPLLVADDVFDDDSGLEDDGEDAS